MATFTPLTPDQFQSAQNAGFSTDQIISNEKIRQEQSSPGGITQKDIFPNGASNFTNSPIAGKVEDFLFPIVNDVKNDIQGNNQKTFLQQAGDLGLSALPFIPGLGEVGIGAKIVRGALLGYGAGVASNLSQGQGLGESFKPNTNTVVGTVTGGAFPLAGKLLGTLGDKISFSVIKPSIKDVEDGFLISTVKDNNLGGTLNQTLKKTKVLLTDLSSQLRNKLQGSNNSIDLATIFDETTKQLTSKEGTLAGFGQNSSISKALTHLQDEVLRANPSGSLSIPDAQVVKQAAGGLGAWEFGKTDPDSNALETVYNAFYNNIKVAIEKNSPPGVADINAKISQLIPVQRAVIRRMPVAERNGAISLLDMIGLVGTFSHPAIAIPTAMEMGARSGTVGNILSKFANQTPKATGLGVSLTPRMISGSMANTTPSTNTQ